MAEKNDNLLSMEIGSASVRMLEYNPDAKRVEWIEEIPASEEEIENPMSMEKRLAEIFQEGGVRATLAACCVSGLYVCQKRIRLHPSEPDIGSALEWEIAQQLLCPVEQFQVDYQEITPSSGKTRDFLVAACRNEYIDRIVRLLHRLKLNLVLMDVDLFALQNAFELNYPERIAEPVAIVWVDSSRCGLVLCQSGMVRDFEVIPSDGNPEKTAAQVMAHLQSLLSLPMNQGFSVKSIWIGGQVAENDAFMQAALSAGHGAEINLFNPLMKVNLREGLGSEKKDVLPSFAVVAGLALHAAGDRI